MSTSANPSRRRTRRSHRSRRRLTAIAITISIIAILFAGLNFLREELSDDAMEAVGGNLAVNHSSDGAQLDTRLNGRPTYRYSVIPGGAYDEVELKTAIRNDAVVAAHYRDLDTSRVRVETVSRDRHVYVSYRKGNETFWTKNKVLLRQGETILTDGKTQIRARCGNCISEQPQAPTAENEPETVEFDRLVDAVPSTQPSAPLIAFAPAGSSAVRVAEPGVPGASGANASLEPFASGGFGQGAFAPLAAGSRGPASDGASATEPLQPRPANVSPRVDVPTFFPVLPEPTPHGPDTPLVPPDIFSPPPSGITPTDLPSGLPGQEPTTPVAVPEPGTLILLASGIALLARATDARRHRKRG